MKYVFKRDLKEIDNWNNITMDMENQLDEIQTGRFTPEEAKEFMLKAISDASVNEEKKMALWDFDNPASMPADARCDYVYRPTYLMTLTLITILNEYPELMKISGAEETLRFALNGCAGRDLCGSGYEAYEELCRNVLLVSKDGYIRVMRFWPLFSINFEGVYRNALNQIEYDYRAGKHAETWGRNCKEMQKEIIEIRYAAPHSIFE